MTKREGFIHGKNGPMHKEDNMDYLVGVRAAEMGACLHCPCNKKRGLVFSVHMDGKEKQVCIKHLVFLLHGLYLNPLARSVPTNGQFETEELAEDMVPDVTQAS